MLFLFFFPWTDGLRRLWSFQPCRDFHVLDIDHARSQRQRWDTHLLKMASTFCCCELQEGSLAVKAVVKKLDPCLDPRFLLWIFPSPQPPAQWGHILGKGSRVPLGISFIASVVALIKVHGQTFARLPFLPNMSWTWWIWYVSSTALPTVSIHKCQQASGLPHRADASGLENYINSHQAFLPHHVRHGERLATLLSPWRKVTSRSFCHHLSFFLAPVVCNWLHSPRERWLEVSTSGGLSSSFHLFLIPWLTGFEL